MTRAADLEKLSVLIVCEERDDRKTLFDTLDGLGPGAIYTARDIVQAREFLSQIQIGLLVLELGFDSASVDALLEEYLSSPDGRIMAVMPGPERETGWSWEFLPPRVRECVASPVDPAEVAFRLRRLLADPGMAVVESDGEADELELLLDGTGDDFVLSDPKTGQILAVNQGFLERAGGDAAAWIGQDLSMIGLLEDDAARQRRWRRLTSNGEVSFRCQRRDGDGVRQPVLVRRTLGMFRGELAYLTVLRDIAGEVALSQAIRRTGSLFAADAPEQAADRIVDLVLGLFDFDYIMAGVIDDDDIVVIAAHARGESGALLSDPERHLPYRELLRGEPVLAFSEASSVLGGDPFLAAERISGYIGMPIMGSDGHVTGVVIGARRGAIAGGQEAAAVFQTIAGLLGMQREIRELRHDRTAQGLHDVLTGLPNRLLFNDRLDFALSEARRAGEMVALMFVDLDRFKNINDSLGHSVGDQVLTGVASRLIESVRASDTVARYAGDEFTIVMRHVVQKDDVMRIAQKVNRVLAEPLQIEGQNELQITASIGVSFFPDDGQNAEQLLRHADLAMYGAKGMGRNTFQHFVEQPNESDQQKLQLEASLRRAEANGELRIFYQPQVATDSEDIVGMEALIRWEHPELGLISPGFFIPLAEETGLIVPMGEWLLRRAVAETRAWHDRFGLPLVLGVNLSPLQLKQPNLVAMVQEALEAAELEPRFLDLEVTESISIKSISGLRERLEDLRNVGCSISIDDFGTGQSSLDYLKRFPADRIKIDQSFVRNIGVDPDDEAIVRATISMAHSLKLGVIAEGVEGEDHLDFLRRNDCDECQGFLFCRPLPADSFTRLLLEREALTAGEDAFQDVDAEAS
ncbi:MAG: EAL domain-containing protein [Pseudomonadota bacterium]